MIEINNIEHFREALKFARASSRETRRSFLNALNTLNRIKRNSKEKLCLSPDWVKHSFIFAFEKPDGKRSLWGGWILHGYEETLSVTVDAIRYPQWRIHT